MRRPFVAGNWKMNLVLADARALVAGIRDAAGDDPPLDLAVCPAFPYLLAMQKATHGSPIATGAQNMYFEEEGAFTGEVSAAMLTDTGCRYVILGHSERRHVFGETDELINKKIHVAIDAGLTPIFCVGELLEDRDAGKTEAVIDAQIRAGLDGVQPDQAGLVIAYEPVWAIGTGRNATAEQAQEVHHQIRGLLARLYDDEVAGQTRILYGGSVKPGNAGELMALPDVDGALVGGASLEASDFVGIIRATISAKDLG